MAVPNTSTFTLIDVTNEFGLAPGDGLQDCFDDSVDADFDVLYKGSKDRLSNFRNYNGAVLTSFSSTLGGTFSGTDSCNLSSNQTYYHNGANASPAIGDKVYLDASSITPLSNDNYIMNGLDKYYITGGVGEITSILVNGCLV